MPRAARRRRREFEGPRGAAGKRLVELPLPDFDERIGQAELGEGATLKRRRGTPANGLDVVIDEEMPQITVEASNDVRHVFGERTESFFAFVQRLLQPFALRDLGEHDDRAARLAVFA